MVKSSDGSQRIQRQFLETAKKKVVIGKGVLIPNWSNFTDLQNNPDS